MKQLLLTASPFFVLGAAPMPEPSRPFDPPANATRRLLRAAAERGHGELMRGADLWQDHTQWETAWDVTTGDYRVRSVQSFFFARQAGTWLETMRGHFHALLGGPEHPAGPVLVHILPGLQDYRQLGDDHGDEHSSFYGSFFAINAPESPVATYYEANSALLGMWLTHASLHEFVISSLGSQPAPAIMEGLASYFSLYYWAWAHGVDRLEQLENEERFLPLEALLRSDIGGFMQETDARLTELGMLFAYLLHFREDTRIQEAEDGSLRGPAVEYLRRAVRGQSTAGTEVERLLTRDLAVLEEDFRVFRFPK